MAFSPITSRGFSFGRLGRKYATPISSGPEELFTTDETTHRHVGVLESSLAPKRPPPDGIFDAILR